MKHYTEHILELFYLKSKSVSLNREEIEEHLTNCAGCTDLFNQIADFYKRMDKSIPENKKNEQKGQM